MSKKKPKSRKKLGPRRLQVLEEARLFADATFESRRPLGWTSAQPPDHHRKPTLHGSVVARMLICCCVHGGLPARALVAVAIPTTTRVETRIRDAHTEELHSFIISDGVVSSELKKQAP